MTAWAIVAEILAIFACAATFLPYIRTDRWWIRMFDFPRMQLLMIVFAALAIYAVLFEQTTTFDLFLIGVLVVATVVQFWHIFPYTPIARVQVKSATGKGTSLKLFIANVQQENTNSAGLLEQIEEADPDIVLLSEVDERWNRSMRPLQQHRPYTVIHPQENTYGINLYSKFELEDAQVRNLVEEDVPSIRTRVLLTNGRSIMLYGVHPRPPGIRDRDRTERQDSTERDAELVVIAHEVERMEEPFIIAGDFNDVAWSHTTRLFQRISRALDPRVGRGMYNSFNARSRFFRYPLDHLFHSDHFTLKKLERKDFFGSDHFPMLVELQLEQQAEHEQEAPTQKANDRDEAQKILGRSEVSRLKDPVIVAGDFNDVAWSHTTRLFQRLGGLLDPRVGRGFYNTYNADCPFFVTRSITFSIPTISSW